MLIEAITVCVNFADYLEETMRMNANQFDRRIIVTTPEDIQTQLVARKYGSYIKLVHKSLLGSQFNKGAAINAGLEEANLNDWICHIDSDIVLPPNFRQRLEKWIRLMDILSKSRNSIIGMARYMVHGKEQWAEFKRNWNESLLELEPPRVDHKHIPVGFYQLWHSSANVKYPDGYPSANTSDLKFGMKFKHKRQIPECCYHLSSTNVPKGNDWYGRKTKGW